MHINFGNCHVFGRQFQYILDDEAGDVLPGERYMMALTSQTRYYINKLLNYKYLLIMYMKVCVHACMRTCVCVCMCVCVCVCVYVCVCMCVMTFSSFISLPYSFM